MTLLHSHGRTSSRCSSFTLHVSISASRVSCCGRARHQRYATIAAEDITPDKPPPPPLRNPFPFPKNSKPTPHQIFHLPFNATQAQIKKRYYELVHAHHPDSQHAAHLPWDVAQHRFRSIKASYDYLTGRAVSPDPNARPAPSPRNFDPYVHEMARRRRAYYASQAREPSSDGDGDGDSGGGWGEGFGAPKSERSEWNEDGWKERMVLAFGVVTLVAGLFPTMPTTLVNAFLPTSSSLDEYGPTLSYSASPSPPNTSSSPIHHHSASNSAPSTSSAGFSFPFIPDFNKRHREAVNALVQARNEREEMGVERREGLRKRVKEMEMARGEAEDGSGPRHPAEPGQLEGTTTSAAVEESVVVTRSTPEDASVDSSSNAERLSTPTPT